MPTVKIIASEYMDPSNTRGFAFDYTHLPNLNDRNIIDRYYINFYWYVDRNMGYPNNPSTYEAYMYDIIDGEWEYQGYGGLYAEAGGPGWLSNRITDISKPKGNKIGAGVGTSYFDQTLGGSTSPYIDIYYFYRVPKITLEDVTDKKENEDVVLEWESDIPQTKYEVIYTNNNVTKTLTGTTDQSVTIERFSLVPGKLDYEVRVYNGYEWSEWAKGSINIIEYPIRLTLEPNKIAQNKDKPIVAMWNTTDTQTQFKLLYSGNGAEGEVIGTTAKTHTFPPGVFGNGTVTLTLQVFNGYVWTEKTAEFMAYGAPPNPILTTSSIYETAIPKLTWTSEEQVSYRLQILKDEAIILDSSDVYSSNKTHTFKDVLENNTTYTARLRIRNQYEIESEWVSKEFNVKFAELQKASFDMFANDRLGTVMFNVYNALGQDDFSHCEILRREYGDVEWDRIATDLSITDTFTDYTCRSGVLYEYKVRAIGTSGGYTDSDTELKEVKLRNTMISDTTDFSNYVVLTHNPKKGRTFKKETHAMQYSGSRAPRFEFGDVKYQIMSNTFTVNEKTLDKLLELYYSNNILLLRDNRGKKIYGYIDKDPNVDDAEFMKYKVDFKLIETDYNEEVLV